MVTPEIYWLVNLESRRDLFAVDVRQHGIPVATARTNLFPIPRPERKDCRLFGLFAGSFSEISKLVDLGGINGSSLSAYGA